MLPALTLIISSYVLTRMAELLANESREGGRPLLRTFAVVTMLLTFVSCAGVQFSGTTGATP